MTKLEKLYSIIENSRDVGVKLPKEVLQQVEELEENIIKEEILPALSSAIAPRLEPIKRDLVLVVEYHPGEPISVALSRKAKISEIMGAKTLTESNSVPVNSKDNVRMVNEPTGLTRSSSKGMRVTFPDGTVVWSSKAVVTFIETLRKIGFERVSKLGIKRGRGYNIVGKEKRPPVAGHIWQHECDGWYVYSNISNATKAECLKRISDHYNLGLKIEEGKPDNGSTKKNRRPIINEEAALWNLPIKIQFQSYLSNKKAESTANSYTSTLDNTVREWVNKLVDENADSVFSYTSLEDVRLCIDILNSSTDFVAENNRKHHSMSAALNQYLLFMEEWEKRFKK